LFPRAVIHARARDARCRARAAFAPTDARTVTHSRRRRRSEAHDGVVRGVARRGVPRAEAALTPHIPTRRRRTHRDAAIDDADATGKDRRTSHDMAPAAQTPEQMSPEQRDAAFAMAGQEMEYRVELFNKMVASCYEKCVRVDGVGLG